jgi:hypothetical protein
MPTVEQAQELVAFFGGQKSAAKACGVSRDQVRYWLRPDHFRTKSTPYAARRRAARVEQGLCADCGKEPLATETRCYDCNDWHHSCNNWSRSVA